MTYGSESWTLTNRDRSRVQASEMRTLRTIARKTRRDKIRNTTIRNQLGVAPMMNKIEKGQLRWLGHLERMDDNRVAKKRWTWKPDGRRSRGRPGIDGRMVWRRYSKNTTLQTLRNLEGVEPYKTEMSGRDC